MGDINKPSKRIFWKAQNGEILHEGFTEPNQQTTTGLPIFTSDTNADNLYTPLPSEIGTPLSQDEIYSYDGGMVQVTQDHNRTEFEPSQTPNLFNVHRANIDGLLWVKYENVEGGDTRTYNSIEYYCNIGHLTEFTPDLTPNLWTPIVVGIPVWKKTTGAHDAYKTGDKVHYPTIDDQIWISKIDANTTVPDGDTPFNRYWEHFNN